MFTWGVGMFTSARQKRVLTLGPWKNAHVISQQAHLSLLHGEALLEIHPKWHTLFLFSHLSIEVTEGPGLLSLTFNSHPQLEWCQQKRGKEKSLKNSSIASQWPDLNSSSCK